MATLGNSDSESDWVFSWSVTRPTPTSDERSRGAFCFGFAFGIKLNLVGKDPRFRYTVSLIQDLKHFSEKCLLERYECLKTGGFFLFILNNYTVRSVRLFISKECHYSFTHLVNRTICYTVPCHTFSNKIKSDKLSIPRKRAKKSVKRRHSFLLWPESLVFMCFETNTAEAWAQL